MYLASCQTKEKKEENRYRANKTNIKRKSNMLKKSSFLLQLQQSLWGA